METLLQLPIAPAQAAVTPPAAAPAATGTHWLWWLFLLGATALCCTGPTSAWH